jgi:SEC-C motif-containing protein
MAQGFATSSSPLPGACPCGAGAYEVCCAPLIRGQQLAPTAERLMRSRYSAFALAGVELAACGQTRWLGLTVLASEAGDPGDAEGTVEFQARWSSRGRSGVLEERSRFGRGPQGQWLYLEALA